MTKLNENVKYKRSLKQAGVTSVASCYRDHADPVCGKRGLIFYPLPNRKPQS